MPATYPTHWPENFETEHLPFDASAAIVHRGERNELRMHKHITGQIALCLRGRISMLLEKGHLAVPARCAVWVPAGVMHCGQLTEGSESVFLMVNMSPEVKKSLPKEPARLMINQMTNEMIRYFATVRPSQIGRRHYQSLAYVIIQQLVLARPLPMSFAPMPEHPALRYLSENFADRGQHASNADWAAAVHMSETTLRRLVFNETGLTLKNWRVHLALLAVLPRIMSSESVESVAHSLGYLNTSAFIKAFRRVFGMTPGQMRLADTMQREHRAQQEVTLDAEFDEVGGADGDESFADEEI